MPQIIVWINCNFPSCMGLNNCHCLREIQRFILNVNNECACNLANTAMRLIQELFGE